MLDFTFSNTTKIIFGKEAERQAGRETARWGQKVLLHYGGGHIVRSGLKKRVAAVLKEAGLAFAELGGVQPNPRVSLVREGIEFCRQEGIDVILAVGGGSVIDSAKALAIGVPYRGDVWDFYSGKARAKESLPVGVVLTIPAAGSESSTSSVLTNEDGWLKRGYGDLILRPKFALLNPELTYSLPSYHTACGAADMLAHILERYFTKVPEVGFSDQLCEAALRGIIWEAPRALQEPNNYGARANLMWAGTIAHNDLLGAGREGDWASHALEHELSGLYDLAHGAGLAIVFPAWMKYVSKHDPQRFLQFAVRVFGVEQDFRNPERTIREGIRRLQEFFRGIGLPTTFKEAGLPGDRLEEMAEKCTGKNTQRVGSFLPLDQQDVLAIYKLCL